MTVIAAAFDKQKTQKDQIKNKFTILLANRANRRLWDCFFAAHSIHLLHSACELLHIKCSG